MSKKSFYIRLAFSVLFMLICLGGAVAEGVYYYMCRTEQMPYMKGFLMAVPTAIVIFWFGCFFDQVSLKKSGGKKHYVIKRIPRKILSTLFTLLCSGAVFFWLYIYHTNIARLF
ncbi:MAG: hypothetical protein IKR76_08890 [Ruminococcus sp.]|nr:hypothetical protein [Ruminococcus sp.]